MVNQSGFGLNTAYLMTKHASEDVVLNSTRFVGATTHTVPVFNGEEVEATKVLME